MHKRLFEYFASDAVYKGSIIHLFPLNSHITRLLGLRRSTTEMGLKNNEINDIQ